MAPFGDALAAAAIFFASLGESSGSTLTGLAAVCVPWCAKRPFAAAMANAASATSTTAAVARNFVLRSVSPSC